MNPLSKKIFKPRRTGEKELTIWRAVAQMNGIFIPEAKDVVSLDQNQRNSEGMDASKNLEKKIEQ